MPKMTRYERVSVIFASVALLLAIASPFISYYWFDPQFQAFRHRARLQVTGRYVDAKTNKPIDAAVPTDVWPSYLYQVAITNIGELPGKEIKVVTENASEMSSKASEQSVSFDPRVPYDVVSKNSQSFITINRALAPHDTITMTCNELPSSVAVSSEFGETTRLSTGMHFLSLNTQDFVHLKDLLGPPKKKTPPLSSPKR
jgi:hypothetical protein